MITTVAEIAYHCPDEETLDPEALGALQRGKLSAMLHRMLATNAFYREKLTGIEFNAISDPLDKLHFTTRAELERDQAETR